MAVSEPLEPTGVERLTVHARDDVVGVLTTAFLGYPVMTHILGSDEGRSVEQVRHLATYYTDKRFLNDWPVFGIRHHGSLAAAAIVSPPRSVTADERVVARVARLDQELQATVGKAAFERMLAFEAASDENEPEGRFHFLGMLGVVTRARGLGLGRRLIEAVKDLARAAGSDGVALSTEDPANLAFYERCGFEVIAHLRVPSHDGAVPPLETWGFAWSVEGD